MATKKQPGQKSKKTVPKSRKTGTKPKKSVTKKPVDGRKNRNTDFDKFKESFRDELRKQKIKLKGRGAFLREAGKIWQDLKARNLPISKTVENIDVIVDNYILQPLIEIAEAKKPVTIVDKKEKQFEKWLIKEGLFSFYWWEGVEQKFPKIFQSLLWKELEVNFLRIVDDAGDFRDLEDADMYKRQVHKVINTDVKAGRYKSSPITFAFKGIIKEDDKNIVVFSVSDWYFGIMVSEPEEPVIEEKPTEAPKEEKVPPKEKPQAPPVKKEGVDVELDRLIKYKQSIMEDIKFAKEIDEDYKEDLAKYKAVKAKIDQLMK